MPDRLRAKAPKVACAHRDLRASLPRQTTRTPSTMRIDAVSMAGGALGMRAGLVDRIDRCVAAWTKAHRKTVGPDALIPVDRIHEWEGWCREGKRPQEIKNSRAKGPRKEG